uniref:Alanine--glyoxylate aminotransferase 2, mitochondrial n=1 Tax=Oreochromis niloticus TaxID=8128 RepID=I3JLI4_ORENI
MSKDRMIEIRRQNCNPMTMKVTYYKKPVFIHQGYMQWLWDVDGRRYLDLFAGVATVSVGHCHPKVTAAAEQQLKKLWHTTNIYVYPTLHEYCEKLASHFPDPLKVIYLTNSGSEANDLAILMARLHTGNYDIISLRGSYHGGSPQTIGLTSNAAYKYPVASGFGCTNTMCPDVFRGPWGGSHCRDSPVQTIRECTCAQGHCMANQQYIAQLKETFATSVPNKIAAFFGEPIQGVGGAVQYPKNYLKEAYKLVREQGGICVADEVQTGFGRTGSHFWGFQGHDVIPDMVTMAKGIGNGFPMGAVVTTPEIAASFSKGLHFNTFGGNPLACAVASSVLDTIREDDTQQNSLRVGTYLITELAKLRDKYEIIGDVRGKGLQIGVEMVRDKVQLYSQKKIACKKMYCDAQTDQSRAVFAALYMQWVRKERKQGAYFPFYSLYKQKKLMLFTHSKEHRWVGISCSGKIVYSCNAWFSVPSFQSSYRFFHTVFLTCKTASSKSTCIS